MKPTESVALATWMMKHFTVGPRNEALVGDLLEEFRGGRSVGWYWRQALCAIAVGVSSVSRNYALPLVFSAAWSMLYPLWWLCIVKIPLPQTLYERWATVDLPYSTSLQAVCGILPAIAFVWLGFFVYRMLHTGAAPSWLRLFASLSMSLNVFLVATIGLWIRVKDPGGHMGYIARENFHIHSHLIVTTLPLALSLLSALSLAFPRAQSRPRATASIAG